MKDDYIFNEIITLNPTEVSFVIQNVKFTCLIDNNFENLHVSPSMKQLDHLHFHIYYELFYVESGSMKVKIENEEKILSKNNLLIISPRVNHRSYRDSENVIRYNLKFFMERTSDHTDFSLYDAITNALSAEYLFVPQISALQTALKNISTSIHTNNKLKLPLAFHEMIYIILSAVNKTTYSSPKKFPDSHTSRIYKIHHIITMHYMDDISLGYIAESLFLSTRQVNRIIQSYYGCTFSELITRLRMNAAADFLISTPMKVSEIASRVGYNSLNGFYSAFKKQYKCLPLNYRKQNIKDQ